jgi:hypothetical protein
MAIIKPLFKHSRRRLALVARRMKALLLMILSAGSLFRYRECEDGSLISNWF